jgi:hypothetical protein
MIGLFVQIGGEGDPSPNLLYHKILNKTIIEHTLLNAVKCSQAHRVILVAPTSERKKLESIVFQGPIWGRPITIRYFEPTETPLDAIFKASNEFGLDHLARVRGHCPLLQPWLISNCILKYQKMAVNQYSANCQGSNRSFLIELMPFWFVAEKYSNLDEGRSSFELSTEETKLLQTEESVLKKDIDLQWDSLEKHQIFEKVLLDLVDYDIEDIVENLDKDAKQNDT